MASLRFVEGGFFFGHLSEIQMRALKFLTDPFFYHSDHSLNTFLLSITGFFHV